MLRRRLLCLCLLLLTQCKEPPPAPPQNPVSLLPPETQTGQRTFGCLVNGQAWTLAGSPFGGPLLTCSYLNSRLAVVANRQGNFNGASTFQRISLVLDNVTQRGKYAADDAVLRVGEYEDLNKGCVFTTSVTQTGTIEVTYHGGQNTGILTDAKSPFKVT